MANEIRVKHSDTETYYDANANITLVADDIFDIVDGSTYSGVLTGTGGTVNVAAGQSLTGAVTLNNALISTTSGAQFTGAVTLTNTTVSGYFSTTGAVTLTNTTVSGDFSTAGEVTIDSGSTLYGTLNATGGSVTTSANLNAVTLTGTSLTLADGACVNGVLTINGTGSDATVWLGDYSAAGSVVFNGYSATGVSYDFSHVIFKFGEETSGTATHVRGIKLSVPDSFASSLKFDSITNDIGGGGSDAIFVVDDSSNCPGIQMSAVDTAVSTPVRIELTPDSGVLHLADGQREIVSTDGLEVIVHGRLSYTPFDPMDKLTVNVSKGELLFQNAVVGSETTINVFSGGTFGFLDSSLNEIKDITSSGTSDGTINVSAGGFLYMSAASGGMSGKAGARNSGTINIYSGGSAQLVGKGVIHQRQRDGDQGGINVNGGMLLLSNTDLRYGVRTADKTYGSLGPGDLLGDIDITNGGAMYFMGNDTNAVARFTVTGQGAVYSGQFTYDPATGSEIIDTRTFITHELLSYQDESGMYRGLSAGRAYSFGGGVYQFENVHVSAGTLSVSAHAFVSGFHADPETLILVTGSADAAVVEDAVFYGGTVNVADNGIVSSAEVYARYNHDAETLWTGGTMTVETNGSALDVTVGSDGLKGMIQLSGGNSSSPASANSIIVNPNGGIAVDTYAEATNVTLKAVDTEQNTSAVVYGALDNGSRTEMFAHIGSNDAVISSLVYGRFTDEDGGVVNGGSGLVFSGAMNVGGKGYYSSDRYVLSETVLETGGSSGAAVMQVFFGTVENVLISAGGEVIVSSGAKVYNTLDAVGSNYLVKSGGSLRHERGGDVHDIRIENGGRYTLTIGNNTKIANITSETGSGTGSFTEVLDFTGGSVNSRLASASVADGNEIVVTGGTGRALVHVARIPNFGGYYIDSMYNGSAWVSLPGGTASIVLTPEQQSLVIGGEHVFGSGVADSDYKGYYYMILGEVRQESYADGTMVNGQARTFVNKDDPADRIGMTTESDDIYWRSHEPRITVTLLNTADNTGNYVGVGSAGTISVGSGGILTVNGALSEWRQKFGGYKNWTNYEFNAVGGTVGLVQLGSGGTLAGAWAYNTYLTALDSAFAGSASFMNTGSSSVDITDVRDGIIFGGNVGSLTFAGDMAAAGFMHDLTYSSGTVQVLSGGVLQNISMMAASTGSAGPGLTVLRGGEIYNVTVNEYDTTDQDLDTTQFRRADVLLSGGYGSGLTIKKNAQVVVSGLPFVGPDNTSNYAPQYWSAVTSDGTNFYAEFQGSQTETHIYVSSSMDLTSGGANWLKEGILSNTTVSSGGTLTGDNHAFILGGTAAYAGTIRLQGGAWGSQFSVANEAHMHVLGGASAYDISVQSGNAERSGGYLSVYGGGSANNIVLEGQFASMTVSNGGIAQDVLIVSKSIATIGGGGTITDAVLSGGTAGSAVSGFGGGTLSLNGGAVGALAENVDIYSGGVVRVAGAGDLAANVVVRDDALLNVVNGSASSVFVLGSTALAVAGGSGALITDIEVGSSGTASGGSAIVSGYGAVIYNGKIYSSGVVQAINNISGNQYGGGVENLIVSHGGELQLGSKGAAYDIFVVGSGSTGPGGLVNFTEADWHWTGSAGFVMNLSLGLGATYIYTAPNGDISSFTNLGNEVEAIAQMGIVSGGVLVGAALNLNYAGHLYVGSSPNLYNASTGSHYTGRASMTQVGSQAQMTVLASGLAISTFVSSGGLLIGSSAGSVAAVDLSSGAAVQLYKGVRAEGVVLSSGAKYYMEAGGGTDIDGQMQSGSEPVSEYHKFSIKGGSNVRPLNADGSTFHVFSGGTINVLDGGRINELRVSGGGEARISGGVMSDVVLSQGIGNLHAELFASGGRVENLHVFGSGVGLTGGTVVMEGGTVGGDTTVENGASVNVRGGLFTNATVRTPDFLIGDYYTGNFVGGSSLDVLISSGAGITVKTYGTARNTTVSSGAFMRVEGGRTEGNTTIESGAVLSATSGVHHNAAADGRIYGVLSAGNLYAVDGSVSDIDLTGNTHVSSFNGGTVYLQVFDTKITGISLDGGATFKSASYDLISDLGVDPDTLAAFPETSGAVITGIMDSGHVYGVSADNVLAYGKLTSLNFGGMTAALAPAVQPDIEASVTGSVVDNFTVGDNAVVSTGTIRVRINSVGKVVEYLAGGSAWTPTSNQAQLVNLPAVFSAGEYDAVIGSGTLTAYDAVNSAGRVTGGLLYVDVGGTQCGLQTALNVTDARIEGVGSVVSAMSADASDAEMLVKVENGVITYRWSDGIWVACEGGTLTDAAGKFAQSLSGTFSVLMSSGAVTDAETRSSGVFSGGMIRGSASVLIGGVLQDSVIDNTTLTVSGGTAAGFTISGVVVSAGSAVGSDAIGRVSNYIGYVNSAVLASGGTLYVDDGAVVSGGTVLNGASVLIYGGTVTDGLSGLAGAQISVSSSAAFVRNVNLSGGTAMVAAGTFTEALIGGVDGNTSGLLTVGSGANLVSGITVARYGTMDLNGGIASDVYVSEGVLTAVGGSGNVALLIGGTVGGRDVSTGKITIGSSAHGAGLVTQSNGIIVVDGGSLDIRDMTQGGQAIVSAGQINVMNYGLTGGRNRNVNVQSGARMVVAGGTISDSVVDGSFRINSGSLMNAAVSGSMYALVSTDGTKVWQASGNIAADITGETYVSSFASASVEVKVEDDACFVKQNGEWTEIALSGGVLSSGTYTGIMTGAHVLAVSGGVITKAYGNLSVTDGTAVASGFVTADTAESGAIEVIGDNTLKAAAGVDYADVRMEIKVDEFGYLKSYKLNGKWTAYEGTVQVAAGTGSEEKYYGRIAAGASVVALDASGDGTGRASGIILTDIEDIGSGTITPSQRQVSLSAADVSGQGVKDVADALLGAVVGSSTDLAAIRVKVTGGVITQKWSGNEWVDFNGGSVTNAHGRTTADMDGEFYVLIRNGGLTAAERYASSLAVDLDITGSGWIGAFGLLRDGSIHDSGYLTVSGGTVNGTTVVAGGIIEVGSGVWTNAAGVSENARGIVENVTIDSNGSLIVEEGAVVTGGRVLESGLVEIHAGQVTGDNLSIEAGAQLIVSGSAASVENVDLTGGTAQVIEGAFTDGSVAGADENARGLLTVSHTAGNVENIGVGKYGLMNLEGGTVKNVAVSGGTLNVTDDGTGAYAGTILGGSVTGEDGFTGTIDLNNGGIGSGLTVGEFGKLNVNDGTAENVTVSGGLLHIGSEGTAIGGEINTGSALLETDGLLSSVTVNRGAFIQNGSTIFTQGANGGFIDTLKNGVVYGSANRALRISDGGSVYLGSAGTGSSFVVGRDGELNVVDGAEARTLTVDQGVAKALTGGLLSGGTVTGNDTASGRMIIVSGGLGASLVAGSRGIIEVGSDGVGFGLTAMESGFINGSGGLIVNGNASGGLISVISGGSVFGGLITGVGGTATVYGSMTVGDGGFASGMLVREYGELDVLAGGSALAAEIGDIGTLINSGFVGSMLVSGHFENHGSASYTSVTGAGIMHNSAIADHTVITSNASVNNHEAGIMTDTTVEETGNLDNAGSAFNTLISGQMHNHTGAFASGGTVYGDFYNSDGASASDLTVMGSGSLWNYGSGLVTSATLNSGAYIADDATTFTQGADGGFIDTLKNGVMYGSANASIDITAGTVYLGSAGVGSSFRVAGTGMLDVTNAAAYETQIDGVLNVNAQGAAVGGVLNGSATVTSDGRLSDMTVNAGAVVADGSTTFTQGADGGFIDTLKNGVMYGSANASIDITDGTVYLGSAGIGSAFHVAGTGMLDVTNASAYDTQVDGAMNVNENGYAGRTLVDGTLTNSGITSDTTIAASGVFTNNGSANATTLYGTMTNESDATATLVNVKANGVLTNAGAADMVVIESAGSAYVTTGILTNGLLMGGAFISAGSTTFTQGADGGFIDTLKNGVMYGSANASIDITDGAVYLGSGGSALNILVTGSNALFDVKSAAAENTVVSGGSMFVRTGGTALGGLVHENASQIVSVGSAENFTINGTQIISGGGRVSDTVIGETGILVVSNGTFAGGTVFGQASAVSGAVLEGGTLADGGRLQIASNVTNVLSNVMVNEGAIIAGSGVSIRQMNESGMIGLMKKNILYGGSGIYASGTAAEAALMTIGTSGAVTDFSVESGTLELASQASVSGGTVFGAGSAKVAANASAFGMDVYGSMSVQSKGSAANNVILSGGVLSANDRAVIAGNSVRSGGLLIGNGEMSATMLDRGGVLSNGAGVISQGADGGFIDTISSGLIYGSATSDILMTGTAYIGPKTASSTAEAANFSIEEGYLEIRRGAVVTGGTVFADAEERILSGGTAAGMEVFGTQTVSSGGTIEEILVHESAVVSGAGIMRMITLDPNASVTNTDKTLTHLGASAALLDTFVKGELSGDLNSGLVFGETSLNLVGGTATDFELKNGAEFNILSSGTAADTTASSGAFLNVQNGSALGVTLLSGAELQLSESGYAENILFETGVTVNEFTRVDSGSGKLLIGAMLGSKIVGSASGLNFSGSVFAADGGQLENTRITAGSLCIGSLGYASATDVMSGTEMTVDRGSADVVTVHENGTLRIVSSGSVTGATAASGALVQAEGSGVSVVSAQIGKGASMQVRSGASALSTTILTGGVQYVGSAGYSDDVNIGSGGALMVANGGTATDVTLVSGGSAAGYVHAGSNTMSIGLIENGNIAGYVSGLWISGSMKLGSGADAWDTVILSKGTLNLLSGASATSTWVSSGATMVLSGGSALETTLGSGAKVHISSGGVLDDVLVGQDARVSVYKGGSALNVDLGGSGGYGKMWISSGGYASHVLVGYAANEVVYNGGYSVDNIVGDGGRILVSRGGLVESTVLESGGGLALDGGTASATTVGNAFINVSQGGTVKDVTVSGGGRIHVYSGSVLGSSIVNGGGAINLMTDKTVLGGSFLLDWSDTGSSVQVGTLNISSGTTVQEGTSICMNLAGRTDMESPYYVNDMSSLTDVSITVAVTSDMEGLWTLAGNAASYTADITLLIVDAANAASITAEGLLAPDTDPALYQSYTLVKNETLAVGGLNYTYCDLGSDMVLLITGETPVVEEPRSNLLENGCSQIVAFGAKFAGSEQTASVVGYVANAGMPAPAWVGTYEWTGSEMPLWDVVGVGHFSGSAVGYDGILLYNRAGSTFAAWTDLNDPSYGYVSLCHVDGNFQTKCLADFDSNGFDDVIIYDENGSVGIVSDAAAYHDVWHVDDPSANAWSLLGAGRFDTSLGQDSILFQNTVNNHLYLWDNQGSDVGTWKWTQTDIGYLADGWEFAAIGDFSGDGIDDIALVNTNDNNAVFVWDNGDQSTQHYVGILGEGFKVEAVGDYDGDGKEDLLLREYNTGWGGLGYWSGADANSWFDLNARIETNSTTNLKVIAG